MQCRWMLALEEQGGLTLLKGVPRRWLAEGDYSFERLGRIYRLGNVINVDCGIGYLQRRFRRLAAIRLDDMKEFYYPD